MDNPDCDSTWEEDEEDGEGLSAEDDEDGEADAPGDADAEDEDKEEARPSALQSRMAGSLAGSRNWQAVRDTLRYRHHYPGLVERDSNGDMPNLSFYRNEIRFLPNGCFIEDILQNWRDDYDLLEDNHSYIQWLFPLREPGVNWHAKPLTKQEVEAFRSCTEAGERLVQAYELMLGFYGIRLDDRDTGKVCRAQNYAGRFQNLNCHSHNNLRITRILKALGELGLERYQAPLVRFFLEETLVRGELPGVRQSALDYFVFTVRCRRQRRALLRFAWEHFRPRRKFVWGPHDKLRRLRLHAPPRPPLPAGPGQAEGEDSLQDPLGAGAQGLTCRPGTEGDGDSVAAGPQPPSTDPQEAGALERDQGKEAGKQGEEGPEPSSPKETKESKKRKLEVNRVEQAPGDLGPQSPSDVEKITLNLEGCALSQGSQEVGSQERGEAEPPCPPPSGAKVADEARKRRKVGQGPGDSAVVSAGGGDLTPVPTCPPAPSGCSEAGAGANGGQEEAEGQGEQEQGAPATPAAAGCSVDERPESVEAEPSAAPPTP